MTFEEHIQNILKTKEKIPINVYFKAFKKGDYIVNEGEIIDTIYFVNSGIAAAYTIDTNNQEKIIDFGFPSEYATSLASSILNRPSKHYTICLTDCLLQYISFKELKKECETSLFANQVYVCILETNYVLRVKKEHEFLTKKAEERYKDLLQRRPTIFNEISIGDIAKYIGIHPSSLSRIRKKK